MKGLNPVIRWAAPFAVVALVYSPVFHAGLIWNDPDYVTKPALRSLHGLWRIWFEVGATEQYCPVLHTAFWVQHRLWGDAALGYHLANLALHATAAGLLACVLRRLAIPGAFFAALLFAVHPVCVESVAWISEQKNTLSLVFYLAAALAYFRFEEGRGIGRYLGASALFAAALLSKSVAATLPGALLVLAWLRRGRIAWRADVLPLLPWFAAGAAWGLFAGWVERHYVGAQGAAFSLTLLQRVLLAGRAVWFYLGKFFWPANLNFIYPRWTIDPGRAGACFYPLGIAALIAAAWLLRRRTRAALAALLIFIGSLFPTLGFFNVYAFLFSYVADHWEYLALAGGIGFVAAAWGGWANDFPGRRAAPMAAASAVVVALGLLSWRQARRYEDAASFYRLILERNPAAWLARNNLGSLLTGAGHPDEAVGQFREAMKTAPADYPEIHANLADAWVALGKFDAAAREYEAAIRIVPTYVAAQANLANVLLALGRPGQAIEHYSAALRVQPDNADCELDLGLALLETGHPAEAAVHDQAALRLRPDFPEAYNNLGNALAAAGRLPEAIASYQSALRQRPGYRAATDNLTNARYRLAEQHANRGSALAQAGMADQAAAEYREALRILPDDPAARREVQEALDELGRK